MKWKPTKAEWNLAVLLRSAIQYKWIEGINLLTEYQMFWEAAWLFDRQTSWQELGGKEIHWNILTSDHPSNLVNSDNSNWISPNKTISLKIHVGKLWPIWANRQEWSAITSLKHLFFIYNVQSSVKRFRCIKLKNPSLPPSDWFSSSQSSSFYTLPLHSRRPWLDYISQLPDSNLLPWGFIHLSK